MHVPSFTTLAFARSGAARWLRTGLAVVALLATQANVSLAALGEPCARTDVSGLLTVAGAPAHRVDNRVLEYGMAESSGPSGQAPAPSAAMLQCSAGIGVSSRVVDEPASHTDAETAALPDASQLRPIGIATPPPLRPPRGN